MRSVIGLLCLALGAWGGVWFVETLHLFPEQQYLRDLAKLIATILALAFLIRALGLVLLNFVLCDVLNVPMSNILATTVYGGLSFVALLFVLHQIGVPVAPLLTTSVIFGAILGLALQPTLGNLIAGISILSDRTVAIGDSIDYQGIPSEVISVGWRHTTLRYHDNSVIKIPNSKLSGDVITVFPEDRATMLCVTIPLPSSVPPNRIKQVVHEVISQNEHIDSVCEIECYPLEVEVASGAILYHIGFGARSYTMAASVRGEIITQLWYGFRRAGIEIPANRLFRSIDFPQPDVPALLRNALPHLSDETIAHLTRTGTLHMFGENESLGFSGGTPYAACIILEGTFRISYENYLEPLEYGALAKPYLSQLSASAPSSRAELAEIAAALAEVLGPAAGQIMERETPRASNPAELITNIADAIPDSTGRSEFLAAVKTEDPPVSLTAGAYIPLVRSLSGRIRSQHRMSALTQVLVLTFSDKQTDPHQLQLSCGQLPSEAEEEGICSAK